MSRSYKKVSICGNSTAVSDKEGKIQINRRIRLEEKSNIHRSLINDEFDDFLTTHLDHIPKWGYLPKDGKHYINERNFEDKSYFRKCMKK